LLFWGIVALLLCVGVRERSFWTDEWYAFKYFDRSFFEFLKAYWQNPDNHPPGYYLILLAFIKLLGRHDFVVRLPSLLAGFGALIMTWRIARLIAGRDERWPYFAVLLAATSPYLIILSQTARYFSLAAFFALFAIYTVLKIITGGERTWFFGYAIALVLIGYVDYTTFLYVSAGSTLVILFTAWRAKSKQLLMYWLLAVASAALLLVPLLGIALAKAQAEAAYGGDVLTSGPLAWLLRIGIYGYAALYGFVAFPWDLEVTIPLALAFLLLIIVCFRDRAARGHFWRRPEIVVITVMGVLALVFNTALFSFLPRYTPLAYPRYVSFALYLFFLLLAALVWWITDKRRGIRLVIIVLLLATPAWSLFDTFGVTSADPTLFSMDRNLYRAVEQGDYIMINDDFPRVIFDWYREKYFANVTPLETPPNQSFFESGKRLWVIGYGYDDRDGFRAPRQKAEDITEPLGDAVRVIEKGYGPSIDSELRAFKKRLTGHDTYEHKIGLFLITAADK